jgi:2-polyprenyl-3-methyl-5-hydroxy-6-metoxy-1,4-benzoquinol methylase
MLERETYSEKLNLKMQTFSRNNCCLCGQKGLLVQKKLCDRLYDVSGEWDLRRCQSGDCELVWLDPTPIEEDIGKAYINYFTHHAEFNSSMFRFRQKIKCGLAGLMYGYKSQTSLSSRLLALPLRFFPFLQERSIATSCLYLPCGDLGKLLEVGFGNGILLNNLRCLGWSVEGVDFDPKAIDAARQNFNLNVSTGSLQSQNYPENKFDAIVMNHVIEHVHDPQALLTECYRIMKPGGKLVVLTPNIQSQGYSKFGNAWIHLDPPRHLNLFSTKTLNTLASISGLKIVKITTSAKDADTVWMMSHKIKQSAKWKESPREMIWLKVYGKIFQIKESLALLTNATIGEELILIATK